MKRSKRNHSLLITTLALWACGGAPPTEEGAPEAATRGCPSYVPLNGAGSVTIDNQRAEPTLMRPRSMIVTQRAGYAAVEAPFSLGRLLADDANYVNVQLCIQRPTDKLKDVADFQRGPFQGGSNDTQHHNDYDKVKIGTVSKIVDTFEERILSQWPQGDGDGPFRLLAVVNRLDLAGDLDSRGGGVFAGAERRWFGEGRLVFGLKADLDAHTPYPMTLIMEYRLPALSETVVGGNTVYSVDPNFSHVSGPASNAAWIDGRARWAKVWRSLSRYQPSDPNYQAALLNVVKLFATADNHLALRTGERVRDLSTGALTDEFEYREFYLNDAWNLATRKMRREPILCSQGSDTLAARVGAEWDPVADNFHFTYMLGDRKMEDPEVQELSDRCGGGAYLSPDGLPYGQDLKSGGFGLRAKFTRFKASTVWTIDNLGESQRHQTAAGTCSGCHATETNNLGVFHISPRLEGADAQLSAFLKGPVVATPQRKAYDLDEMGDRVEKLQQFEAKFDYSKNYPRKHAHEELYCNNTPCSKTEY
ncbi:MAG: hypothetical protein U1E65_06235 [Myxococcota bacterium]